jgi:hypothetical protein
MFDEQNQPEDIFAETDPAKIQQSGTSSASGVLGAGTSSLSAVSERVSSRSPSKLLFVVIVLIVLSGIGAGVWYFILRDAGALAPTNSQSNNDQALKPEDITPPEPPKPVMAVCGNAICEPGEESSCLSDCPPNGIALCGNGVCDSSETTADCSVDCPPTPSAPVVIEPEPANQPLDSDGDGLSDEDERSRGTNPQSADTDADGLSDREEVFIYNTDPINPDTDGDGYIDGEEVRAGYNPRGPGKLFNLPQ